MRLLHPRVRDVHVLPAALQHQRPLHGGDRGEPGWQPVVRARVHQDQDQDQDQGQDQDCTLSAKALPLQHGTGLHASSAQAMEEIEENLGRRPVVRASIQTDLEQDQGRDQECTLSAKLLSLQTWAAHSSAQAIGGGEENPAVALWQSGV